MHSRTQGQRPLRPARSFVTCLRDFLTPQLWKQAHAARNSCRSSRWYTQPLVLTLLLLTYCQGDAVAERFAIARAYCVVCLPQRRRPGRTAGGFHKALARLPMPVLRVVAAGIRRVLASRLSQRWQEGGFIGFGCDGARLECPRAEELEQRLGCAGKKDSAPTLWLTALVHLQLGLPWAWRWGKGTASERHHLLQLLPLLPAAALVVADAGYFGLRLAYALAGAAVAFLLRMSSLVTRYTTQHVRLERFREGLVYYWPKKAHKAGQRPLLLRLIRIRGRKRPYDVWLLTNVLERRRLSAAAAGQWYRRRWESAGLFRTYKRTLKKVKLVSRTVRLVHREAEGSLLATQLLLALGVLALRRGARSGEAKGCSPRKVLLAVRAEMGVRLRRGQRRFYQQLQQAERERRQRRSAKEKREWPRRKGHQPPKPPKILKLTKKQKVLLSQLECEEA